MSAFFCMFVFKRMNELTRVALILGLSGGVPAAAFALLCKSVPRVIFKFLVIAILTAYSAPTVTYVYLYLIGAFPGRGPLSESPLGMLLGCDLLTIWLLAAATLPLGVSLAVRDRQIRILMPYIGLMAVQIGWASLDSAFFIALIA